MESVSTLVDGDMVPSNEEIVFECPSDPKVISISENMSLAALRKKNFNANRGRRILINLFYRQSIYKMMVVLNTTVCCLNVTMIIKGLIELNAIFERSPDEIVVLPHKPRKPRTTDEIIVLMCDEYV
ncbi:hypothetical protein GmHk_18G051595 [Glycine max]|nr:hypothetical protein GmHk_18G051595 [Glycine max]